MAGFYLSTFWNDYLYGNKELDYNYYLEPFGIELRTSRQDIPFIGMALKSKNGIPEVEKIEFGSPAQKAGISTGDMVIAIAGIRVTAENFNERLRDFAASDAIAVTIFHQDLLRTVEVTLQEPIYNQFELVQIDNASPNQELNLRLWLRI